MSLPCLTIPASTSLSPSCDYSNIDKSKSLPDYSAMSDDGIGAVKSSPGNVGPRKWSTAEAMRRPSALQLRQLSRLPVVRSSSKPEHDVTFSVTFVEDAKRDSMVGSPAKALRMARTTYGLDGHAIRDPIGKIGRELGLGGGMPDSKLNGPTMKDHAVALEGVSSEVGMMKLVYQKARSIRESRRASQDVTRPSVKELVKDLRASYRICVKAKDFIDLALEGVLKADMSATKHLESDNPGIDNSMQVQDPVTPSTAKETVAVWSTLLSGLDSSPKNKSMRSKGLSFGVSPVARADLSTTSPESKSPWRIASDPFKLRVAPEEQLCQTDQ